MELLSWLGPELWSTAGRVDAFPAVHAGGPAAVRTLLEEPTPRARSAGAPILVVPTAEEMGGVIQVPGPEFPILIVPPPRMRISDLGTDDQGLDTQDPGL